MTTLATVLLVATLMTSSESVSEPVIVLTYRNGETSQRVMSDGDLIVSSYHVEGGRLLDCDARFSNTTASRFFFREALTHRATSQTIVEYDIKRLARQCKRFLRKMLHADEKTPDPLVRTIKQRQRLQLGFPGAPWCGVPPRPGQKARKRAADKCCQALHTCPQAINEYETGWNLFNYWNHRVYHCRCVETFKQCLKKARKASADEVGRLYFDVLHPKCFRLEDHATCTKWDAWFTSCLKEELEDNALFFSWPKYDS